MDAKHAIEILEKYKFSFGDKNDLLSNEDIITLLKIQEPIYPIRKQWDKGWFSYCPKCFIKLRYKQKFCMECGQAVKWE